MSLDMSDVGYIAIFILCKIKAKVPSRMCLMTYKRIKPDAKLWRLNQKNHELFGNLKNSSYLYNLKCKAMELQTVNIYNQKLVPSGASREGISVSPLCQTFQMARDTGRRLWI